VSTLGHATSGSRAGRDTAVHFGDVTSSEDRAVITYALTGAAGRLDELGTGERAVFRALYELTQSLDVRHRCAATLAAAEALFDATSSWILLLDEETQRLEVCIFRGHGADCYAGLEIPADAGLVGRALSRRELVFVPAVNDEAGWYDADRMRRSGLRSVLLVPLVYDRRAVGVLALDSPRFSATQPPDGPDLARLEALATVAAISIENARLYEHSERDRRQLREALEQRRQLREEVRALRSGTGGSRHALIGSSAAMDRVRAEIDVVAQADATVLLTGETGTGKELVARAIHEASRRAGRPFVPVNCAALPESLIESELFGHERGAFTGAIQAKPGKFELAHRGTLFLDEVGDLPLDSQATLLRVLQDGLVERVGSTRAIPVDVRIVAATNVDLEDGLARGRFRADLFYRLSVFPIRLAPLRDRRGDIPLLGTFFASRCADQVGRTIDGFSPEALERLVSYEWPGNVRELQNIVERAVLLTQGSLVQADAIAIQAPPAPGWHPDTVVDAKPPVRVGSTLADVDRDAILRALESSGWRISGAQGAARALGVKPTTLHSKMKRLGIRRPGATPDDLSYDEPPDA
jgi:formate hydrogenlyase transcriptional activator